LRWTLAWRHSAIAAAAAVLEMRMDRSGRRREKGVVLHLQGGRLGERGRGVGQGARERALEKRPRADSGDALEIVAVPWKISCFVSLLKIYSTRLPEWGALGGATHRLRPVNSARQSAVPWE
jgi:hypothetical protein